MHVPNKFPSIPSPRRIALIGEAPGKDEEASGTPFIGASGRFLNALLSKANIVRETCFVGNVCQVRPPDNDVAAFDWGGDEIQSGLAQLKLDLDKFKPNLIVCLGATALHAFKEPTTVPHKRKSKHGFAYAYPNIIDNWRGSLFPSHVESPAPGVKCLATHHPAFCLRMYENTPLLMMDLNKVAKEGNWPELVLPQRELIGRPPFDYILKQLGQIRLRRTPISLDIEGGLSGVSCLSIADAANHAFNIPFFLKDGTSCWLVEEEATITLLLAELLADPNVPKTFQNGLYDRFVLQYGFQMPVLGNADDTMLKWWEKYCELEKGLGVQASILTNEPYYKGERKSDDDDTFFIYCCKDSALTFEINEKLNGLLDDTSRGHYRFNMTLLNILLYMELRGIRYDVELAKQRRAEANSAIYKLQNKLNQVSGFGIPAGLSSIELELMVRNVMCYKRDPNKPKADFVEDLPRALALLNKPDLSEEDLGWLSIVLGKDLNIKSVAFKDYLYKTLDLPVQRNKTTGADTTDYGALLKLRKKAPGTVEAFLTLAIDVGNLRTRAQMLEISADDDGRVRCGYNVVGSDTGRITCYTSPTGSGYNLQTLPDKDALKPEGHPLRTGMRDLCTADPGHWCGQCDLRGSDGWTIGAHLNRLGAPTMLEDLRFGIKPASRICYMLRHGVASLRGLSREETKSLLKEVKKEDWDYFACKVGIWGICYLMGPDLLSDQILEESEGRIALSRTQVAEFHRAVFEGYHVKLWHDWMKRQLAQSPVLMCPSGTKRRFFGRPDEILGVALATEPQNTTTYVTNLAAYRLWMDPENRVADKYVGTPAVHVPFRVEPLHQVHDALIVQFHIEDTAWAVGKLNEWFNNPITIAGQSITIPFEGNYGPSWGQLDKGTI